MNSMTLTMNPTPMMKKMIMFQLMNKSVMKRIFLVHQKRGQEKKTRRGKKRSGLDIHISDSSSSQGSFDIFSIRNTKSAVMERAYDIIAVIFLLFLKFPQFEMATTGKVLEETYRKWVQYKDNCVKMIENEPLPEAGLFCNRTFDRYACWPDTPAGSMVNISCPFYLPWYDKVSQGVVRRQCGSDGLWERDQNGQVWRDMTQCEEEKEVASQELWFKQLMVTFRMLYTVGYSLSLTTLITALIILLSFRRLHCTRNYIHANLFLSFILRAVAVIVKDNMLERHWGREIMKQTDVSEMLSHQAAIGCRIAQAMMQYCVLANHYWFFGEAVYLYTVLIASVFIDSNKYLPYICLGWGEFDLFMSNITWIYKVLLGLIIYNRGR